MYPHIALNIQQHKPSITFHPEENMSRQLTMREEDLAELMQELAEELDLIDDMLRKVQEKEVMVDNLLHIAREAADVHKVEQFPDVNTENVEFNLRETLTQLVALAKKQRTTYDDVADMTRDVRAELERNENQDIFASTLEAMYNVMIANTLLAASEIGVGKIKLVDEHKNTRLQEKMAQELEKMGLELIVE